MLVSSINPKADVLLVSSYSIRSTIKIRNSVSNRANPYSMPVCIGTVLALYLPRRRLVYLS